MRNNFRDEALRIHNEDKIKTYSEEADAAKRLFEQIFNQSPSLVHKSSGTVEKRGLVFRRVKTLIAGRMSDVLEVWDKETLPDIEIWTVVRNYVELGEAILSAQALAELQNSEIPFVALKLGR